MWELGQVRVPADATEPTAGPETSIEEMEGLLGRQGLAVGTFLSPKAYAARPWSRGSHPPW